MHTMLLLTWNLNKKEDALRLALSYLAGLPGDFLAVFQELPGVADSVPKALSMARSHTENAVTCLGVVGSARTPGRLGLFASPEVTVTRPFLSDANRRTAITTVRGPGFSGLQIAAVHAFDRLNVPTNYARGALIAQLRLFIDSCWDADLPMAVLGDFNAEPYHLELCSYLGMFAVRDRNDAESVWASPLTESPMRPLYNPMWSLLPEGEGRPGGTLHLSSCDEGIRWRLCDQILISPDLIEKMAGTPEVLSAMGNTSLLTKDGYPQKRLSDHLPVQLRLGLS